MILLGICIGCLIIGVVVSMFLIGAREISITQEKTPEPCPACRGLCGKLVDLTTWYPCPDCGGSGAKQEQKS